MVLFDSSIFRKHVLLLQELLKISILEVFVLAAFDMYMYVKTCNLSTICARQSLIMKVLYMNGYFDRLVYVPSDSCRLQQLYTIPTMQFVVFGK